VVTRRRSQQHAAAPVREPGPDGTSDPSKASVRKTMDSVGLRIETIESAVSTGSQVDYFKPEQTMLIFDWDDTICPSSWIQENRRALSFFRPVPNIERFQKPLRELQMHAEAALRLGMKMGTVVIVTNASDLWVETSCRNFLPQLLPLVQTLPVVYARSRFYSVLERPSSTSSSGAGTLGGRLTPTGGRSASQTPTGTNGFSNGKAGLTPTGRSAASMLHARSRSAGVTPQRWKELAFEQEISCFYSRYAHQSWKNVVSIGDSVFERDALVRVVQQRPNTKKRCRTKTLKMFDDPTIEELIAQLRLMGDLLGALVQYDGDLNIEIDAEDLREVGHSTNSS